MRRHDADAGVRAQSQMSFHSMLQKPANAPTGRPSDCASAAAGRDRRGKM